MKRWKALKLYNIIIIRRRGIKFLSRLVVTDRNKNTLFYFDWQTTNTTTTKNNVVEYLLLDRRNTYIGEKRVVILGETLLNGRETEIIERFILFLFYSRIDGQERSSW